MPSYYCVPIITAMHVYMTFCHVCMCPFTDETALVHHKRKGTGLERLTKGLGTKITIEIPEGLDRPEKPMQAALLASECGYIARSIMPVLPHFKEYKKDPKLLENFIGKVAVSSFPCT